ncbi:MAG: ATP-binding protein [Thioalkalivibrionaceae bacterium]
MQHQVDSRSVAERRRDAWWFGRSLAIKKERWDTNGSGDRESLILLFGIAIVVFLSGVVSAIAMTSANGDEPSAGPLQHMPNAFDVEAGDDSRSHAVSDPELQTSGYSTPTHEDDCHRFQSPEGCDFATDFELLERFPVTVLSTSTFDERLWPNLEAHIGWPPNTSPEVIARQETGWQTLPRSASVFGNRPDRSFSRFALVNTTDEWLRVVVVHEQTFVDDVRLYHAFSSADGAVQWRAIRSLRDIDGGWFGGARNPVFEIDLPPGARTAFLSSIQTRSLTRFPLRVLDAESFQRREQRAYIAMGVLLVIPVLTSAFLWLLWSATGRPEMWILATMLLTELVGASWGGGVFHVVMPHMNAAAMGLVGVTAWWLTLILSYAHVRLFLDLKRDQKRMDRLLRALPWLAFLFLVLEPLGLGWNRTGLIYLAGVSLLIFVGLALLRMRQRLPYAGVYAFAWSTYLASVSLSIANTLGWVEPNVGNLGLFAQGSMVSLIFGLAAVGHLRERERRTRDELEESRERFVLAAQGASVGLFDWRVAADDVLLSGTACRLMQLPGAHVSQPAGNDQPRTYPVRFVWRHLPLSMRKTLRREWSGLLTAQCSWAGFESVVGQRPVFVSAAVALTVSGPLRVSGSIADASVQRELLASRERAKVLAEFALLFDNTPVGLYRADSQGRVLRANRAYRALQERCSHGSIAPRSADTPPKPTSGEGLALVARSSECDAFYELLSRRGSVDPFQYELIVAVGDLTHGASSDASSDSSSRGDSACGDPTHRDPSGPAYGIKGKHGNDADGLHGATGGREVVVLHETARVAERNGDRLIYEGAVIDVSERERLAQALTIANQELQAVWQSRERLFAATNHDLRQPLQSMGLYIELLRETPGLPTPISDWIERLSRAQSSLTTTIDDLLQPVSIAVSTTPPSKQVDAANRSGHNLEEVRTNGFRAKFHAVDHAAGRNTSPPPPSVTPKLTLIDRAEADRRPPANALCSDARNAPAVSRAATDSMTPSEPPALELSVQIPVAALLVEIADEFQVLAERCGVRIRVARSAVVIIAPRAVLSRMLRNLIGNALRHAAPCRILLGARRRGDRVAIWVCDDGPGIAPDLLDLIFSPFVQANGLASAGSLEMNSIPGAHHDSAGRSEVRRQGTRAPDDASATAIGTTASGDADLVDSSMHRAMEVVQHVPNDSRFGHQSGGNQGLGLGLAIVRELGERHGIASGVRSQRHRGSTFWLNCELCHDLRAERPADGAVRNEASPEAESRLLWLVEDDAPLRDALAHGLRHRGWRVRAFGSARAVLAAADACPASAEGGLGKGDYEPAPKAAETEYRDSRVLSQELPVALLLDHQLPDGNGCDLAQALRERLAGDRALATEPRFTVASNWVPVVILSAQHGLQAPPAPAEVLRKPVSIDVIERHLKALLNVQTSTS